MVLIEYVHALYSLWGRLRYHASMRHLRIIGVTGTDGKSSTVYFLAHILSSAGHATAHYSSFSIDDGTGVHPNTRKMTTPGKAGLHSFLDQAYKNGCTHAVVEITSEGIKQHRHAGIPFGHTVITNVTPEHTESHGGFAHYVRTKLSFLETTLKEGGRCTAMIDTDEVATWAHHHPEVRTLTRTGTVTDYTCINETTDLREATFTLTAPDHTRVDCTLPFGGPFVAQNASLALAVAHAEGVPLKTGATALATVAVPTGRFELICSTPLCIVDYGHTIAALEELLPFVRARVTGKVIHVFGAAGGARDHYKRPLLAKLSETHTDVSIVTEENPWDEAPEAIERDILAGFSRADHVVEVLRKREDAVRRAFALAKPNDCILLTAKGAETVIAGSKGARRPYEERMFVQTLCS